MQISTKGRYALRLMLDLAVHNTGELVKIKDISARENISEKYLEQIISIIKEGGICKEPEKGHRAVICLPESRKHIRWELF